MLWYHGFSGPERTRLGAGIKRHLRNTGAPPYSGPCMLCGDPEVRVELHAEDYAEPFLAGPPGIYWLCRHCHRAKLHKRFWRRELWAAFLAHVRRGGYARDLRDPVIRREFESYRRAIADGRVATLRPLRERGLAETEWWDLLTLDERCATPDWQRPVRSAALPT